MQHVLILWSMELWNYGIEAEKKLFFGFSNLIFIYFSRKFALFTLQYVILEIT